MDSPTAADSLAEAFYAKFGDIARHPGSGHRRDDLGAGVRTAVVGNYLVLYRQADVGVEILHVAHGARDIQSLL
jgi:toxin ParE1/3/4